MPASPAHCAICLAELALPFTAPPTDALALAYHLRCLRELFGTTTLPRLDLDTGEVMAAATAMAGKMSISGF